MQAWSFAVSSNNDGLQSALVSVLALLLKTISTLIDLRQLGSQVCRTLLQPAQLKLVSRGLAAPKQKEHVISPCLRLLAELTSFDGGAFAGRVWAAKSFTFEGKTVARNLAMWNNSYASTNDNAKRPSVRSNAVRYVLALFKYLSSSTKVDLSKNGNVLRSLFEHLKHDVPSVVKDVLEAVKACLLSDTSVPKVTKSYILNEQNLCSVASIIRQEAVLSAEADGINLQRIVDDFLKYVCTIPEAGCLRSGSGWYPPGTHKDVNEQDDEDDAMDIDLGLSSIDWYERYHGHVPIRNTALAALAQYLRPYADVRESDLLLDIFRAAPELVADYFFKKSEFTFDPKLTTTWIGYSAFLFSTIQLPVPSLHNRRGVYGPVPPPISIVIESILPQPLTQKVLTRCLNQQSELITFFALRILIVACTKLQQVMHQFKVATQGDNKLWEEAANRLVEEFMRRCPTMKDVVAVFRKTSIERALQREACLRLLRLYYQTVPQVAMEEKFDVSVVLAEALSDKPIEASTQMQIDDGMLEAEGTKDNRLHFLQLSHLLHIASWTPDMKWWQKPESLQYSTFTTMLRVLASAEDVELLSDMRRLLGSITEEHGILQSESEVSAFDILVLSLRTTNTFTASDGLFAFLDDVFARLTKKPIKYLDDLSKLQGAVTVGQPVSLLHLALVEQWPFHVKDASAGNIAAWLAVFFKSCEAAGEDKTILKKLSEELLGATEDKRLRKALQRKDLQDVQQDIRKLASSSGPQKPQALAGHVSETKAAFVPDTAALAPPAEDEKHAGLHRWQNKDVASAITSGEISALMLCLSSEYGEVRRAALTNLLSFMSKLSRPVPEVKATSEQASDNIDAVPLSGPTPSTDAYTEGYQYYLMLGILTTTATPYISRKEPVPYICTAYAALVAGQVLHDPLHPMYDRVCRFHTRSPRWDVERMPSWWVHQLLHTPAPVSGSMQLRKLGVSSFSTGDTAEDDGANTRGARNEHHAGLLFLVNYVYSAIRTEADLQILRQRGTFEPLLSLAADPYMPQDVSDAVLKILWRTTFIEGGSTTLITRKGIVAWLSARIAARSEQVDRHNEDKKNNLSSPQGLRALLQRLWQTCDQERVDVWSKGTVRKTLEAIAE